MPKVGEEKVSSNGSSSSSRSSSSSSSGIVGIVGGTVVVVVVVGIEVVGGARAVAVGAIVGIVKVQSCCSIHF